MQLVVPAGLREKVVALAHDTLLSGHRGAAKTPFSTVCVHIIGPLSPPSDGYRYILTLIDMCTRFSEAVATVLPLAR